MPPMDIQKIEKLIALLEQSALSEIEITEGENTIRLLRHASPSQFAVAAPPEVSPPTQVAQPGTTEAPQAPAGKVVESPLVGTFYNSPSPGEPAFVSVGSKVNSGDTLCLIEAMKTFNRVEADTAGTITTIHKANGEPVEFGEALFVIDPDN